MKKIWFIVFAALLLLTSCTHSDQGVQNGETADSSSELPAVQTSNDPKLSNTSGTDTPPIDYETVELPTLAADGDTLVLDTSGYRLQSLYEARGEEYTEELGKEYDWYGVFGIFPFTDFFDTIDEYVIMDSPRSLNDAIAMKVAQKYDSLALTGFLDDPKYFIYESNYPQFNTSKMRDYRWVWKPYNENYFNPLQPEEYTVPIEIYAAKMNWIMEGPIGIQYCDEHGIEYDAEEDLYFDDMVRNDNTFAYWEGASLAEKTLFQDQYMRYVEKSTEKQYCSVSGLTILNGDSRTEESYYAGSRARNIRITINGEYTKELRLADTPAPQLIDLDYTQDTIATPVHIEIEVLDSYAGASDKIYITEIGLGLDSSIPDGMM